MTPKLVFGDKQYLVGKEVKFQDKQKNNTNLPHSVVLPVTLGTHKEIKLNVCCIKCKFFLLKMLFVDYMDIITELKYVFITNFMSIRLDIGK